MNEKPPIYGRFANTPLYASIIAQACNFEMSRMAEITGLSYRKLAWCSNWYLREETIQSAINTLVNYQYNLPLSKYFGDGTLSSSDGQRFSARKNVRNATALPKYHGYETGVSFYSWTSNQFSQYGSKAVRGYPTKSQKMYVKRSKALSKDCS